MSAGTWNTQSVATSGARSRTTASLPFTILKAMGSLKITVTMFGLGILLVLIGTLAQDEQTLAEVKRVYFNAWWTIVPLDVFAPVTIFEHDIPLSGNIPFPGGATIGLILLANLIAAKTTRFSIQGKGLRLWTGIAISLAGAALVTVVIIGGHAADGLQGKPPVSYDALWNSLKAGLALMTMALVGYAIAAKNLPNLARILLWVLSAISLSLALTVILGGQSARLDDPGMRIVWQLLQASVASSVVLIGLWCLFGKRGGNVLIHIGVALLMVGQFVFGDRQVEQRLNVVEGDSTNMVYIQDELEIVFIDPSAADSDTVLAIPEALIRQVVRKDGVIDRPELPCRVKIEKWMTNSETVRPVPGEKNLATAGVGLQASVAETKAVGAAESEKLNIASAYVTLEDRASGKPIETLLVSQHFNDPKQVYGSGKDFNETVTIDGKEYYMALRYRREYKPYSVFLKDVERINYSRSDTPRDYSSRIVITDKATGQTIEERTWMNNPIRYQGETFYQSQHFPVQLDDGKMAEATGLQVVENAGWVIPYVCCMMVLVGMFAHFGGTFTRFANRHSRELSKVKLDVGSHAILPLWKKALPVLIGLGLVACVTGYFAKPTRTSLTQIDWQAVAKLPMQQDGRIKPLDTVARNLLQVISEPLFGGQSYVMDADGKKHSQAEWLVATMADVPWAIEAPVFRIYAKEVRDVFGLESRKGFKYSYAELEKGRADFDKELEPLREKSRTRQELNFREQKFSQMYRKLSEYDLLVAAYHEPNLPAPTGTDEEAMRTMFSQLEAEKRFIAMVDGMNPAAIIPPTSGPDENGIIQEEWQAYRPAAFASVLNDVQGKPVNPAVREFGKIIAGVQKEDARAVNNAVREFNKAVADLPATVPFIGKASAEQWLNKFNPTAQGIVLYLIALMGAFAYFMVGSASLRRTTFWLLVGVFVVHTVAILARMYISGRAPVINLYSSAVFIGWACVLFCLILELVHPIGIANLVAGLIGIITLSIARSLDTSDTLHVLVAVLDTQFWLSTHVVTVTAGYAVTFLAGGLGICALVHRLVTGYDGIAPEKIPADTKQFQDILYRMGYGAVCFGIFFSFVGTVLGGLWADDSWGRFWGWDPKENGALMIVMWNAIVLHARWDKMVGARGFAMLTVVGNIVTAWSWFGTNLLGIGLHNYGFSKSVAYALIATVVIHLSLIGISVIATQILAKSRRLQA